MTIGIIGTIGIVIVTPGTMTVVTITIVESGALRSGMAIGLASVTGATGITIASVIGAGIN